MTNDWQQVVYVKQAPLMCDGIRLRMAREGEILDGKLNVKLPTYLYLDGNIYYRQATLDAYARYLQQHRGIIGWLFGLLRTVGSRFAAAESFFDAAVLRQESDQQLVKRLRRFSLAYQNALTMLSIPLSIDDHLTARIKQFIARRAPDKVEELFSRLAISSAEHDSTRYHRALLRLAVQKQRLKSAVYQRALQRLATAYSYLGIKFYIGRPLTTAAVERDIRAVLKDNPRKEILDQTTRHRREVKQFRQTMKQLKPSAAMRRDIHWLQEVIFIRTWRLERLSQGEYNSFVLLDEIGRRIGVSGRTFVWYRFPEIFTALRHHRPLPAREIQRRQRPYGLIAAGRHTRYYFGSSYPRFARRFHTPVEAVDEIRGQAAYPGLVRGRVCLIHDKQEAHRLRPGDVMVTRMTTPDYIFAMKKAAAVITDVGGITSHAAVVSRELGKPCIVNTRIATRVLKTGDLVEADATKGIIKKL